MVTNLKGDSKGGLLDKLINGGDLPTVKLEVETKTFVKLGLTIIVSIVILILVNALVHSIILKK